MLSLEGRQLGNYTVTRRIRSGGMGAVYEGRQRTAFDRRVAIKVILGTYAEDDDMRRRFAREAKTVARLHHPHILPLIEFGDEQGVLYLVMPFIEGGTLTSYLNRYQPTLAEVSAIFLQILGAVEYAHEEGLIHRDIKSSNVLLEAQRSGPPYAYLADFGLVRPIQRASARGASLPGVAIPLDQVPGTPHYMAPEQTRGIVTTATDIYALGVLLYLMLTGELPYDDPDDIAVIQMHLSAPVPNPCELDASLPVELGAVVARAMAKRAEERFPNVGALRAAFLAAIDGSLARFEDAPFVNSAADSADGELPPLSRSPLRPPRSPRAKGQVRPPQPEPIEFSQPPAPARRRITTSLAPTEVKRPRVTDERDEPPRRPRVTEDHGQTLPPGAAPRHPRTTDDGEQILPPMPAPRQRVAQNNERPRPAARGPRVAAGRMERATAAVLPRPRWQSAKLAPARTPEMDRVEPRKRGRRPNIAVMVSIAVPALLILLLLIPRLFGLAFLPAGVPILGSSPVATIALTLKSTTVHDTFLLTASPQATQPNLSTRVIPDRRASSTASASRTVATTGAQEIGANQATGTLLFTNSSTTPVSVSAGFTFISRDGVQVRLTRAVIVPASLFTVDGTASAPAVAVAAGQNGNLPAGDLNSPCCGGAVTVSNPQAFSGGSDASITHLVAQSDLDGVASTLTPTLRQQAQQKINSGLQPGEVQAGTPTYNATVTADHPVGSVATQVNVSVSLSASALVYNTHTASALAHQLLSNEAAQSLGPTYQLNGPLTVETPTVNQQGSAGQLYLSVGASGLWSYAVTDQIEEQWRQAIKGASLPLAQSYLSTRPGILAAKLQIPFGTDHLPVDEKQIVFTINEGLHMT